MPSSGSVIDLRGTGLREEILGLMREHGIEAKPGSGQQIDASSVPGLQERILKSFRRHGVAPFGPGGPS